MTRPEKQGVDAQSPAIQATPKLLTGKTNLQVKPLCHHARVMGYGNMQMNGSVRQTAKGSTDEEKAANQRVWTGKKEEQKTDRREEPRVKTLRFQGGMWGKGEGGAISFGRNQPRAIPLLPPPHQRKMRAARVVLKRRPYIKRTEVKYTL